VALDAINKRQNTTSEGIELFQAISPSWLIAALKRVDPAVGAKRNVAGTTNLYCCVSRDAYSNSRWRDMYFSYDTSYKLENCRSISDGRGFGNILLVVHAVISTSPNRFGRRWWMLRL
jgi:hypothetical protein